MKRAVMKTSLVVLVLACAVVTPLRGQGCSQFLCSSGTQCIPRVWHCDGDLDCSDGSDEIGCFSDSVPTNDCTGSQFQCPDGECIFSSFQCDGFSDCTGGADEDGCIGSIIGAIVGAAIGGFVLLIVLPIMCIIIIYCCVIRGAAEGSRRRTPVTRVVAPPPTQATVMTATEMQPPRTYPAYAYPVHGRNQQEPPPPYNPEDYPPHPRQVYPLTLHVQQV